jgi:peptidoglycan/LPS O-acetylase OafA/YrhL
MYYIIYGLAFHMAGLRRTLFLLGVALFVGPQILFIFPVWFLGCLTYDAYQFARKRTGSLWVASTAIIVCGLLALLQPRVVGHVNAKAHSVVGSVISGLPTRMMPALQRADPLYYPVGIATSMVTLWALLLLDRLSLRNNNALRIIRRVADGTFSLYLLHFPLLVMIAAVIPYDHRNSVAKILIMLIVTVFCIWVAGPLDKIKLLMRDRLRALAHGKEIGKLEQRKRTKLAGVGLLASRTPTETDGE